MKLGSAREQAMNAARRATMLKSTFASIRHLLDGNEFMNDQNDANFKSPFVETPLSEEDDNIHDDPFKFIDQQLTNHDLASFKGSGSEDDSINDFIEPFQASFPTFSSHSSIVIGDQSTGELNKGVFCTNDDFGFDEVNFNNDDIAYHSNESSYSRKDRSLRSSSSKRLNSSVRSRRKADESDTITATDVSEVSTGSSMKQPINRTGGGVSVTKHNKELKTPRTKRSSGDEVLPMSPQIGHRRRKSKSSSDLLAPRKSEKPSNESAHRTMTSKSNKTRKNPDKDIKNAELNTRSMEMLRALAIELTKISSTEEKVDATMLTNSVVARVKEIQASQESLSRRSRSRSRGRSERLDRETDSFRNVGEKSSSTLSSVTLKEKRSRSRSRSRPRMNIMASKQTSKESKTKSSKAMLEEKQSGTKKVSKSKNQSHSSQSQDLLNEIESLKAKVRRSKSNSELSHHPPKVLLDEIKSTTKSLKRRSKLSETETQRQRSVDSSDNDIIEVLAKLVSRELLANNA